MGYVVIGLMAVGGLGAVGIFVYRLIQEIGPTIHQAKSTADTLQSTIQESKEIGEHFKSISETIQYEKVELQLTREAALETIGQISSIVSVAKPIGDTFQLIKSRIEPQPVPVKAKRLIENVKHRSRKAWEKISDLQNKTPGDQHGNGRLLKYTGIPLLIGTAAGGYAIYLKRRRQRHQSEDLSADFSNEFRTFVPWDGTPKLPPADSETDAKQKPPNHHRR